MALTGKRRLFVEHYVDCLNAAEAARRAGYASDRARQTGRDLKKEPEIAAEITRLLEERAMTREEAGERIGRIASADLSPYVLLDGNGQPYMDLEQLKADGLGYLIKGVVPAKTGNVLQVHDTYKALTDIARTLQMFVDRVDWTTKGDRIQPIGYEVVRPEAANDPDEGE